MNKHTATHEGVTATRNSQGRTYSHAIFARHYKVAKNGYYGEDGNWVNATYSKEEKGEWEAVSWASRADLAHNRAASYRRDWSLSVADVAIVPAEMTVSKPRPRKSKMGDFTAENMAALADELRPMFHGLLGVQLDLYRPNDPVIRFRTDLARARFYAGTHDYGHVITLSFSGQKDDRRVRLLVNWNGHFGLEYYSGMFGHKGGKIVSKAFWKRIEDLKAAIEAAKGAAA